MTKTYLGNPACLAACGFLYRRRSKSSLVGMMRGAVHIYGVTVSTVSMGSVCTLPEYRGRHFASQIVEHVIGQYQDTSSVLLVSGDRPLYRRAGCVTFGTWRVATIDTLREPPSDGVTVEFGTAEDAADLHTIYKAEPLRFERTLVDMASLLQSVSAPRWRRYAAQTLPVVMVARRHDKIVAYVIGVQSAIAQQQMLAIEWAGERAAIPVLAERLREYFGCQESALFVSPSDRAMQSVLDAYPVTWSTDRNGGTLRVLNVARLLKEVGSLIEERAGRRLTFETQGANMWKVLGQDGSAQTLIGAAALSTWFFGSDGLDLPFPRSDDLNYI